MGDSRSERESPLLYSDVNPLMRSWSTVSQLETPSSCPAHYSNVLTL
jgi:hypothetical protein